jgi:hypothetical protein
MNKKNINLISLLDDNIIINYYNKLNELNSNKKYPYNLIQIKNSGFIPTYKNIELKLINNKIFKNDKLGGSNNINIFLF